MTSYKIQTIDLNLINKVAQKAANLDRKRTNHNFHHPEDLVQRFLNAIEPSSYIRPHRHINPKRDEIFLVLRGKGVVVVFTDNGAIKSVHPLDQEKGCWGIDIEGGVFHTVISLEAQSVLYEIKQGPYDPEADKGFAPWSPEENSFQAQQYLADTKNAAQAFLSRS